MKLPRKYKLLKLPRKLKKELKKGFTRNIHPTVPTSENLLSGCISFSIYQNISYSGSNTKSFFRLCKFARKEEQRTMKFRIESMAKIDWNFDNSVTGPIDTIHASIIALYPKTNI